MDWADKRPFADKLSSLLNHIDELAAGGHQVSLVGESAGASAAIVAYAARPQTVHRVACICGKLRNAQTISTYTYRHNPAFKESMAALETALHSLSSDQLKRIRSVHPLADPTVPVGDTRIEGTEERTIPTIGHATSIVLGNIFFSWRLVPFLKRA
jgi:carboxylesterase type B